MDSIQLFRPHFRVDEVLVEIRETLEKGWTGLGYKTVEFEDAWKDYSGLPHAHFLNSATAGLHLALRLFKERDGWQEDDEVITTPLTFVSTNHPILYERLSPVFADVDETLCLSPESIRERITPRTRAVMYVGMGGSTGHLDEVVELCGERDLRLILDAAHMAGTRWQGQHVGESADASVFSYQAVKNLPTADAGMLCFRDESLDREARKWTWLGINKDTYSRTLGGGDYKWMYDVEHLGFKYHGNSVMAAMALVGLRYLDQDNAYRRQLAAWYDASFVDNAAVELVPVPAGCVSSRHLYQVMVEDRDQTVLALNERQIFPGVHYRDNTDYAMYHSAHGSCPSAADASRRLMSLPMHLELGQADVERVAAELLEVAEGRSITTSEGV